MVLRYYGICLHLYLIQKINKMYSNKGRLFLIITFFFLILLLFLQLFSQHWTSRLDQDTVVLYNSLLVANNIQQEYLDHPSFSLFLVNGIFLKLASFIGILDIKFITKLKFIDDFDNKFQHAFYLLKLISLFIFFLSIFVFSKIMKKLNFSSTHITISILFLVTNYYFISAFFSLRSEPIAVLFFLISLYFLLRFNTNQKYISLIFFSVFMVLSLLAKIQLIINYFFLICFLILSCKDYKVIDIPEFLNDKKNIFLFNLLFLIVFSVLVFFLTSKDRYTDLLILEKYFTILFILSFIVSLMNNKIRSSEFFLNLNHFFFLIVIGISLSLTTIFLLDFFEVIAFNPRVFLRLIFPIHYLTHFSYFNPIEQMFNTFTKDFPTFVYFTFNVVFGFIYFLRNHNKNFFKEKKLLIFLFLILIISFISSLFRGFYFYIIIYISLICSNLFFINRTKIFHLIFIFVFSTNIILNFNYFKGLVPLNDNIDLICKNKNDVREYMKYWHQRFDDNFLDKFCLIK